MLTTTFPLGPPPSPPRPTLSRALPRLAALVVAGASVQRVERSRPTLARKPSPYIAFVFVLELSGGFHLTH